MEIRIERAAADEVLDLIAAQDESFRADFERYGECPAYQEPAANMLDMVEHAIVHKIAIDQRIIGDVIARDRGNGTFYLRTIAVIPEYQNLGIGAQAMAFIERAHPGALEWILQTPADNPRSRRFYEKLGYRAVGESVQSHRLTLITYAKRVAGTD